MVHVLQNLLELFTVGRHHEHVVVQLSDLDLVLHESFVTVHRINLLFYLPSDCVNIKVPSDPDHLLVDCLSKVSDFLLSLLHFSLHLHLDLSDEFFVVGQVVLDIILFHKVLDQVDNLV
jgi:hypothetical protein